MGTRRPGRRSLRSILMTSPATSWTPARRADDVTLVLAAQDGDEEAFASLLDRCCGLLEHHVRRFYLPGGDRDDIVQEATDRIRKGGALLPRRTRVALSQPSRLGWFTGAFGRIAGPVIVLEDRSQGEIEWPSDLDDLAGFPFTDAIERVAEPCGASSASPDRPPATHSSYM